MPGILCCFGHNHNNDVQRGNGVSGSKDVTHAAHDAAPPFLATVSTKPDAEKDSTAYVGPQSGQPRVQSPANQPIASALAVGRAGDLTQGLLQGINVQRKIMLLQGHWWTRVEGAVDLLAKIYSAACASVWVLDETTDSFVALLSKGPMRQAVQPGYALHLGSEYDANCPSSLTSLWETKAPLTYSVGVRNSSSSSSLHNRSPFPADWKLLYNAHHFTDFLALPIFATPPGPRDKPSPASIPSDSALCGGMLVGTLGGAAASGASNAVGAAAAVLAANASDSGGGGGGPGGRQQIVGALTLYLSRPERFPEQPPSIFTAPMEQDLVALALAGVLFSTGTEPVRQVCDLVLAVQSAAGSGELAAAVAAGLQARLQLSFAVAPAALLAMVPPKQVSAVVFRDQTAAAVEAAMGAMDSMAGCSSSQTLPLLHPALASACAGCGTSGAANGGLAAHISGSHSHGGGPLGVRNQYRAAGIHLGLLEASAAGSIERSPSLLGTGLRGEAAAGAGAGAGATGLAAGAGGGAAGLTPGAAAMLPSYLMAEAGGAAAARMAMPNSRSMGVLAGPNPSGLFSCRLDRLPSRYKALVFPLSHTLLQVVFQQRPEKKPQCRGGPLGSGAGGSGAGAGVAAAAAAVANGSKGPSALRDLCMSAAAAAAPASGATHGGWIVSDCNEHLHAVHSPSRDIYVMARVNGRRPHSLVLATAELLGLGGSADAAGAGGAAAEGGSGGGSGGGTGGGGGSSATHIALYLAFPEKLPRAMLELIQADVQLLMRQLLAPLIRHRFETSLAEEWSALAGAANNLPTPGGPVLRIASSMSASQARHVPPSLLAPTSQSKMMETSPTGQGTGPAATAPIAEVHNSSTWLSRLGGGPGGGPGNATSPQLQLPGGAMPTNSASELQMEGLSAGEALQQMSVLVSSYMDTLQALQGQLMASDRVAESLRREDLPHLHLLEVLGHGGGGVVFRGKLHALEVAVKVFEVPGDLATAAGLSLNHTPGGHGAAAGAGGGGGAGGGDGKQAAWPTVSDRRVLQRSALELAVAASLSHPHIIQVYSLYTNMVLVKQKPPKQGTSGVQLLELSAATAVSRAEEGIPCSALCMEYCDMGTLAHAIDQHRFMTVTPLGTGRPALKAICTTLLEVALALRHLHARNLAHCDLKPANVLLKSSRRDSRGFTCKLADFGYVSVLKAAVPGGRPTILPEEACGTVTHMAPETFIKGQPLDFSVDTFSFGILMWELYTCARPYSDVPEDQIAQRVTLKGLRPTFPPDTPRSYGALARQCWSQDPNERPSTSEIVSAIENMLQIMNTQLPAIPPLKPKAHGGAATQAPGAPSGGASAQSAASPVGPQQQQQQQQQHVSPATPAAAVVDKPSPGAQRPRGSFNGGMVQMGHPQAQSPLGRVPASPPASPLGKVTGPGAPEPAGGAPAAVEAAS